MDSIITPRQAERILELLADGESLTQSCKVAEVKINTWLDLVERDEQIGARYTRARERGWALLGERLLAVSDDLSIPAADRRIMTDTRKWMLSKMLPRIYADNANLTVTMRDTEQLSTDELTALIRQHLPAGKDSPQT
jgi:hypothetical protein